jgi:aminopeptidase-like protein
LHVRKSKTRTNTTQHNTTQYHIYIDSELKEGSLTYGEILIPGSEDKEIFLSTYICHPSMANNELSGPCVAIYLAKWLSEQPRRFSYRIIFIPETIGSITYLSRNLDAMKQNIIAGFNISCVGDDRAYSYIASRYGNTLADRVAKNILHFNAPNYLTYSFLSRGSDERQYCAPGIDLPLCAICRSKYGEYPEYHTSADNLDLISPKGLGGAFDIYRKCLETLEGNHTYKIKCLGEPQLGKRGLYPTISKKGQYDEIKSMMDFIAYADGSNDLIAISDIINVPVEQLMKIAEKLKAAGLI